MILQGFPNDFKVLSSDLHGSERATPTAITEIRTDNHKIERKLAENVDCGQQEGEGTTHC